MLGRLATGGLVGIGLLLLAMGVQKWFDNRAATATVEAFMLAVKQGNRQAALTLLDPRQRLIADTMQDVVAWVPDPGLEYRIHHIEVAGDVAAAQLWIEKGGFVFQPTLGLNRSETGQWKIETGRLWDDLQWARTRVRGEQLAHELSEALRGRPGISVRRVPMTDPH